jgi:hypothetical protein
MSATGPRPTAGARYTLELAEQTAEAVIYRGFVHLPEADVAATVTLALPGGAATATLGDGGTSEMGKTAAALVRAATKAELKAGTALPRKIVRWRG